MKNKFCDLAKKMSYLSDHHQHRIGTVISKKNKLISVGYNQIKTHTKSTHTYNMVHSEFHALIGLSLKETKGCEAYIYRANKKGELCLAKPCKSCFEMLKRAGIKKVYYTANNAWYEEKIVV